LGISILIFLGATQTPHRHFDIQHPTKTLELGNLTTDEIIPWKIRNDHTMSAPPQDLAALLRQTHLFTDEDILKAANASLKKSKTDETAQRTRVIALLKLERYEDALRIFEDGGDSLKEQYALEHAYALYKGGELDKAREVAQKHAENGTRGLLHVAGQTVRW
jgi:Putative TPR-like repeat